MKLRNKVLRRSKILLSIVALIGIGLWFLMKYFVDPMRHEEMNRGFMILAVFIVLYAIPVFFLNLFAKSFDTYYRQLSESEKERFEQELASQYHGQNTIILSDVVVLVDFIVIRVVPIRDIKSMYMVHVRRGISLILNSDAGALGAVHASFRQELLGVMQDLLQKNPMIQVLAER